jgi:ATP-dependent DNA ligase
LGFDILACSSLKALTSAGVMAKLLTSPYVPGRRLGCWRKVLGGGKRRRGTSQGDYRVEDEALIGVRRQR